MTLLYSGQGNHVGLQERDQQGHLGHCPCKGVTKGIKQGWLGVLDPCVIWSYPVSKLAGVLQTVGTRPKEPP